MRLIFGQYTLISHGRLINEFVSIFVASKRLYGIKLYLGVGKVYTRLDL